MGRHLRNAVPLPGWRSGIFGIVATSFVTALLGIAAHAGKGTAKYESFHYRPIPSAAPSKLVQLVDKIAPAHNAMKVEENDLQAF